MKKKLVRISEPGAAAACIAQGKYRDHLPFYTRDESNPSVLWAVYEEVHAELMHTRKFCRDCHGSGKVTSWDMNGGPPTVQCECRKVPTVSAKEVVKDA